MNVLVTGAKGFIGKNLVLFLKEAGYEVFEYDIGSSEKDLERFVRNSEAVVHLAGVNRPLTKEEFYDGNVNLTKRLIDLLLANKKKISFVFSSSKQAEGSTDYGLSKRMSESLVFEYGKKTKSPVYVYRFCNVFGKWCRPNYNSVIATWCHNLTHDLPIEVNEKNPKVDFIYIDDVCKEILKALSKRREPSSSYLEAKPFYSANIMDVKKVLESFKETRIKRFVPSLDEEFTKKLYATYISYLGQDDFAYPLDPHKDDRGSFTELFKSEVCGQVSVNVAHPGIIKGNHYHNSKTEKYVVIKGECEIKLRKVGEEKIVVYRCHENDLKVVDIPPGYVHSIATLGSSDSITIMWADEVFDPNDPDTYFEMV